MLNRYLAQQAAVIASLVSPKLRRNKQNIDTVDGNDISNAEDIVELLSSLKTATRVIKNQQFH